MRPHALLLPLLLLAATATAQQYDLRRYSLAEGLPQSQVFAAMQDSRGYMWFGTQGGGVCRFDGLDFQTFTTDDGIPSNFVSAIFEDSEHRIWIAGDGRFGYFDGKKWSTQRGNFSEPVNAFGQIKKGQLLIGLGNGGGLERYDSAGLHSIGHGFPKMPSIYAISPSNTGLWIGTNQGAMPLGKPAQRLTIAEGLPSNTVRAFAPDAQGHLWLATPSGIAVVDESSLKILTVHINPLLENALCLQADSEGNMWVGTAANGISIWSPKDSTWTQITEKQGLPHNHVRALVRDNTGQMWAATSGGGVVRFVAQDFTHYDRSDGLTGDRVYAVMEDRHGRIWFSVSQNGLQWLDSTGIHRFERDSGYLNVKCRTLAEDKFGRLWVGTEGKGVAIFDSAGMRILGKTSGLPSDWIQKIAADPSGDMWVATASDGIARISFPDSNSFAVRIISEKEGLKDKRLSTMALDTFSHNSIWFVTQSGKAGWVSPVKTFTTPENHVGKVFDGNENLPSVPFRCLAFNGNTKVWIGTKGEGVYRLLSDAGSNAYTFTPFQTPRPLSSKNIYLLQFDHGGNLWVGTENGVDKISFEKNGFAVKSVEHFGKNEGFLGIETCQDAAICDRTGNLWFGTMNGLTKYTPSNRKFTGSVPVLHFENTALFYKPLSETNYSKWADPNGGILEGLELPWDQNHLSFEFHAIDLNRPDAVQYRWKLDGSGSAGWSPLSPQRSVNFAGLPPGQYSFQVQATSDGETFSEPIKASFSIKIPFWQNGRFQFAAGFFVLGLIFLFARNRIRQVRKTEQARREKLEMQNHLLQLEQKALQLQMNPHFIFNALNSIQSLVSTGDTASARQELNAFAKLMRSILNNSRKQTISLQEEADTLEQYLRLEQFCQQNKFDFSIQLPENVDAAEVELPPMLLQPFVENAVVHGVSHLKYAGKIEVAFQLDTAKELLECRILDNGIGREKAALLRQERTPGHASVAVEVTRERLEALKNGQTYEVLDYSDLTDSEGKIVGTQVIVRLPVAMTY